MTETETLKDKAERLRAELGPDYTVRIERAYGHESVVAYRTVPTVTVPDITAP
jgi:hypothetical protein